MQNAAVILVVPLTKSTRLESRLRRDGVQQRYSAHFKSIAEVRSLWAHQDRRKNEGPLQKGGPSSVFAGLLGSTEPGDSLRWLPPSLAGNGMHTSTIPDKFHKSMPSRLVVFSKEASMNQFDLLKSHIDAYTRKDGTVVGAHEKRIEAHGVKGMKSTPWRKTFKSQKHFEEWQDKDGGNSEVLGFKELDHGDPDTNGKTK